MTQNTLGPMSYQEAQTNLHNIRWGKNSSRTLYLHIGLHKTGTSSLQNSLSKDLWRLRLFHGMQFFKKRYAGPNLNRMVSWNYTKDANFKIIDPVYESILRDLRKSNLNTIISSEDLSLLPDPDVERMGTDLSNIFENIRIIIYLRRQDRMAISLKSQGTKTPQQMLLMGVEDSPLPIKLRASAINYLSYDKLYLRWSNSFPRAQIIIRNYHRSSLIGEDTVTDCYNLIGLRQPFRKQISLNESRSIWKLKRAGLSIQDLNLIWKNSPRSLHRVKFVPSKNEAISFMHNFSQSNKNLYEFIGQTELFDSSFEEYAESRVSHNINLDYFNSILCAAAFTEGLSVNGKRIINELKRDSAL